MSWRIILEPEFLLKALEIDEDYRPARRLIGFASKGSEKRVRR